MALGLEQQGRPGPQKSAANMMQLTWDDELANIAQRYGHSVEKPKNLHYDLLLKKLLSRNFCEKVVIAQCIIMWKNQKFSLISKNFVKSICYKTL